MYDSAFYCIIVILYFIAHMCECHNVLNFYLLKLLSHPAMTMTVMNTVMIMITVWNVQLLHAAEGEDVG